MPPEIPFNKPFIAGKELYYIAQAVALGNISGDGHFTQSCSRLLQERFGIHKVLMTPSCTAALEMAAMLCGLGPGDEVIMPSFTFVSTANAVVRLGAKPVFVDIRPDTLNIDDALIEEAVTPRTKAIFPVHYAGVGCEMDRIMTIAEKYNLLVVEDAAQGVNAFHNGRALGSIGHLGCHSFHETKNYICGEGGALCINDPEMVERAEILRDKGTNRKQFFRGQTDKYTWVDVGGSYVPSELCCAFLYGQLELFDQIAQRRREIHQTYAEQLQPLADDDLLRLPFTPEECQSNYHMFYVLLPDRRARDELLEHLNQRGMHGVFHYVPLHSSPMGRVVGVARGDLPVTDAVSAGLLRLPFYYDISLDEQAAVASTVADLLRRRTVGDDFNASRRSGDSPLSEMFRRPVASGKHALGIGEYHDHAGSRTR
ncbi:MAG TPA: dTDP-4-amino-4,6-dideoxygalactose transaminase [Pirellulales bacterium]|nr:dTDP-4-amino-4,6-dideoxygalactose transaminase [Pirellulales bacterium]